MEGNEKKVGAVVETKKKSKRSFGKSIVVSIMCFMLTFVSIISSFAVEETTDGSEAVARGCEKSCHAGRSAT